MKASDLFVKCLETEGIEYNFGVPGEENAGTFVAMHTEIIRQGVSLCPHALAGINMLVLTSGSQPSSDLFQLIPDLIYRI